MQRYKSREGKVIVNKNAKSMLVWFVIASILVFAFYRVLNNEEVEVYKLKFSQFLSSIKQKEVQNISIGKEWITGEFTKPKLLDIKIGNKIETKRFRKFKTVRDLDSQYPIEEKLHENGIEFDIKPESKFPQWTVFLLQIFLPIALIIGIMYFISRQMQGAGNRALSFGKSKAKLYSEDEPQKTFDDVAGCDEAKSELEEVIEFLKEPKKFQRLGGRIPKGVLLVGPPGTGKTLLAKAVAGEADVPFYNISGSNFVEMFVGVGASRVRDLFETGKKHAPSIIFIDELDAVGRHRGAGIGGGHDEREQTLNQLLTEMQGFDTSEGVILLAATNRPDVLDPALLRPGRFDRQIVVGLPDIKGRRELFELYADSVKIVDNVNLETLAKGTPYFSGADIENMVNEAALLAAKEGKEAVDMECMEEAKDRAMMGLEKRSKVVTEREKRITAYHEAGHALVQHLLPEADPNYKVTIIPRGQALGVTQKLPLEERHTYGKKYLLADISVHLGGRIAEEVIFDEPTTGAKNDFKQSTEMARKMVSEWGMSELGPLTFGQRDEQIFLGREIAQHQDYSEQTAIEIDRAVKDIIMQCYSQAKDIIEENLDGLKTLAEELLERETLTREDIEEILGPRPTDDNSDIDDSSESDTE